MSCGESVAKFVTIPAVEYPPVPKRPAKETFSLITTLVSEAFSLVGIAAAADEGRPILTGISIIGSKNILTLAATDGFRLSVVKSKVPFQLEQSFVLPSRIGVEVIKTALEDKQEKIGVYLPQEKNQAFFVIGDKEIIARLIEGEFPAYEKIIPSSSTTHAVFDREKILSAVKTASIFARQSANVVKLKLEKGNVTISAQASSVGENTTTLDAAIEGEGGEIAFNSKFLSDFLTTFKEEQVVFEMTGPLSPGVFKSEKDEGVLHIIMPVRVQG